jgi:hypothetical protein
MNGIAMFQIGDLVEAKNHKLVGFVFSMIDGKYCIQWFNTDYDGLTIFTNPLDFLRKIDSIDERGVNE